VSNLQAFSELKRRFTVTSEGKDFFQKCVDNPKGPDAQKLIKCLRTVLKAFRRKDKGAGDIVSVGYAATLRYGNPMGFYSGCPNDLNNPSAYRLSLPFFNNTSVPATAGKEFATVLKTGDKVEGANGYQISCDFYAMQSSVTRNPVASAESYDRIVKGVFADLLGLP
jgi:hypothetical protein